VALAMVVTTVLSGVSVAFATDTDTGGAATGTQETSVEATEATDENSSGEEAQETDENTSSEATETDGTSSQKVKSQSASEEENTISTMADESGISGGISWSYANGTLTISAAGSDTESGSTDGVMPDYSNYKDEDGTYSSTEEYDDSGRTDKLIYYAGTKTFVTDSPWKWLGASITEIVIEDGVTSIGTRAFRLPCVTKVSIPASVTTIGDMAFDSCPQLETVEWTGNWDSHAEMRFTGFGSCTKLGEGLEFTAWLPDCFTSMNGQAINGTAFTVDFDALETQMTAMTSDGAYGNSAFTNMSNLGAVTLTKQYGTSAFQGSGVTSITIADDVETIPAYSFENCTGVTSVVIPASVTAINSAAFRNSSLTSITFEGTESPTFNGGTSVAKTAFDGVELTTLTLNENMSIDEAHNILDYFSVSYNSGDVGITDSTTITPEKFAEMLAEDVTVDGSLASSINHTNYPNVVSLTITGDSYDNTSASGYPFGHSAGGAEETIKTLTIDVSGEVSLCQGTFLRSGLSSVKITADTLKLDSDVFMYNNSLTRVDFTGVETITLESGAYRIFNLADGTNLDRYVYLNTAVNYSAITSSANFTNNTNTIYIIANGGSVVGETDGLDAVKNAGYKATWYEYESGKIDYSLDTPVTTAVAGKTYIAQWTACSYSADEATITENIENSTNTAELKVNESIVYDGSSIDDKDVWVDYSNDWNGGDLEITYYENGSETPLESAPTDAGTYTAKITVMDYSQSNEGTAVTASLNFTIGQKTAELQWSTLGTEDLVYDGNEKTLSASVSNKAIDEDDVSVTVELTSGTNNINVTDNGFSYTATELTGTDSGNYCLPQKVTSETYKITAATLTADDFTVRQDDVTLNTSDAQDIDFTGEQIKPTVATMGNSLVNASDYEVSYDTNTAVGAESGKVTITGKGNFTGELVYMFNIVDGVAPTGTLSIGENSWTTFWNNVTFGLFFNKTQTVKVESSDNDEVAKTEYYLASEEVTDTDDLTNVNWTTFTESFNIEPDSKYVIYVKITDKSDNYTIINSDGVVVYTDSAQKTESIEFTRTSNDSVTADVTLNGNTVNGITCTDITQSNTTTLGADDYSVDGNGTITFNNSWLKTLTAGEYTLTVSYNPLEETYVSASGNDAPATTSITLTVKKADGSVTNVSDISKEYDGTPVTAPTYTSSSKGEATIEYKVKDADDDTYTTEAPKNAGSYTVKVTVAADDDYGKVSETANFTIAKAEYDMSNVYFEDVTYVYDGDEKTIKIDETTLPEGVSVKYTDNKLTKVGSIEVTATFTGDSNNYEAIEPMTATLTVVEESSLIKLPEQDLDDSVDYMLYIQEGLTEVPEALQGIYDTSDEIESALKTIVSKQLSYTDCIVYDVTLMVSEDGTTWKKATDDNFPQDGLKVELPYPDGTAKDGYNFAVTHMFTTSYFGKTPGGTENPEVTKTDNGIQVTVKGLSPIAVAWEEVGTSANSGTGTGSTGTGNTSADSGSTNSTTTDSDSSSQTGDDMNMALWIAILLAAAAVGGTAIGSRRLFHRK